MSTRKQFLKQLAGGVLGSTLGLSVPMDSGATPLASTKLKVTPVIVLAHKDLDWNAIRVTFVYAGPSGMDDLWHVYWISHRDRFTAWEPMEKAVDAAVRKLGLPPAVFDYGEAYVNALRGGALMSSQTMNNKFTNA